MVNAEASKDERIGFHKGALNTLVSERNELLRIVQITESLIQAHAKELEQLGVRLQTSESVLDGVQNTRKK